MRSNSPFPRWPRAPAAAASVSAARASRLAPPLNKCAPRLASLALPGPRLPSRLKQGVSPLSLPSAPNRAATAAPTPQATVAAGTFAEPRISHPAAPVFAQLEERSSVPCSESPGLAQERLASAAMHRPLLRRSTDCFLQRRTHRLLRRPCLFRTRPTRRVFPDRLRFCAGRCHEWRTCTGLRRRYSRGRSTGSPVPVPQPRAFRAARSK